MLRMALIFCAIQWNENNDAYLVNVADLSLKL